MDLTTEDLGDLNQRLSKLLERRVTIPLFGAQYRLCEAGQKRNDARTLHRAIVELVDNRRPRRGKLTAGPWEPLEDILVDAELEIEQAGREAEKTHRKLNDIARFSTGPIVDDWIAAICSQVSGASSEQVSVLHASCYIGGQISIPTVETVTQIRGHGRTALSAWFSHEPGWIYPDDPRIWRFFSECLEKKTRPLILARKIAPATFPMLKAVGAFALQYYSYLTEEAKHEELTALSTEIGWFHVSTMEKLLMLPIATKIEQAIESLSASDWTSEERLAVEKGVSIGRRDPNLEPSQVLLEWGADERVQMPPNWMATVRDWVDFSRYHRRAYSERQFKVEGAHRLTDLENVGEGDAFPLHDEEASAQLKKPTTESIFDREMVYRRIPLPLR